MRILYLHQYFKTPEEGGALRSFYLSQALAQAGHEVELITAYNGATYKTMNLNGVLVHYLPVSYSNNFGFFRRSRAREYGLATCCLLRRTLIPANAAAW